jgi:hypothetical protein
MSEAEAKFRQKEEKLKEELRGLRRQLGDKEKELKELAAKAGKLEETMGKYSPEEIRKLKVKAHRMEVLYNSMKGLREMAEERNQNWEVALRELSVHVLNNPGVRESKSSMPIGELVGAALELAGSSLVYDEHNTQLEGASKIDPQLAAAVMGVDAEAGAGDGDMES